MNYAVRHLVSLGFSPDGVIWTPLDQTIDWVSRHQITPQGWFVSPRRAARRAHSRRMKRRAQ